MCLDLFFLERKYIMSKNKFLRSSVALLLALALLPLSACQNPTTDDPSVSNNPSDDSSTSSDTLSYEANPRLVISELMARNTVGVKDPGGKFCGWIELQNISDSAVDLSEYSLSYNGTKYALPAQTIPANGYCLLYANGAGEGVQLPYVLGSTGRLLLYHGKEVSNDLSYVNRTLNYSFIAKTGSETATPTPGYQSVKDADQLIISELMSNNSVTPIDGELCDYIELYNVGKTALNLSDYFISEDPDKPYDDRLPAYTIEPGEYTVLIADKDFSFGFSKEGDMVYFTRNDGVTIASLTYPAMEGGQVYTYEQGISQAPSPGYPNTLEGKNASITDRKGLVISEVISSNGSYLLQNGEAYDIVEVWNHSDTPILLSDYYFSDSKKELQRYRLPDITLEPDGYYTFLCTGSDALPDTAPLSISSDGEKIFLSHADGSISDALLLPALPYNVSYGRYDRSLHYFSTPTFGKANGKGYPAISAVPTTDLAPGTYATPQAVFLNGNGTIYYTLDGSRPTTKSTKYNSSAGIPILSTTSIRAIAVEDGMMTSPVVTYSYLINTPDYTLPILSISIPDADIFGTNGIYQNYNSDIEKECNATFFVDGKEEFSVSCGLKIFGGMSRLLAKKSFQLKFKAKYGTSKLNYQMFEDLEIDEFDSLVIRSGSQAMVKYRCFINDELVTSLAASSGNMPEVLTQAYRPCNLYLNDQYFGVYFIREKIDEDFVAAHYNVSPESVTIINWVATVKYGATDQGWKDLFNAAYKKDLSSSDAYHKVADQLCLESLIDVYLMRLWCSDNDSGNIRAFKSTEGDGKWRFILFDCDMSFESGHASGRVNYLFKDANYAKMHGLIRSLLKNDEFRALFLERMEYHCNQTFTPEKSVAQIDKIVSQIEHDMQYNIARWPQYHPTVADWKYTIKKLRTFVGDAHLATMRRECVTVLGLTPEEVRASFGEEYVKYCK